MCSRFYFSPSLPGSRPWGRRAPSCSRFPSLGRSRSPCPGPGWSQCRNKTEPSARTLMRNIALARISWRGGNWKTFVKHQTDIIFFSPSVTDSVTGELVSNCSCFDCFTKFLDQAWLLSAGNVSEHYFLISLRDFKLEKHDSHEFSLFQKINQWVCVI